MDCGVTAPVKKTYVVAMATKIVNSLSKKIYIVCRERASFWDSRTQISTYSQRESIDICLLMLYLVRIGLWHFFLGETRITEQPCQVNQQQDRQHASKLLD